MPDALTLARRLLPCPQCVMEPYGVGRVDTELGVIRCPMCEGNGCEPEALEAIREFERETIERCAEQAVIAPIIRMSVVDAIRALKDTP